MDTTRFPAPPSADAEYRASVALVALSQLRATVAAEPPRPRPSRTPLADLRARRDLQAIGFPLDEQTV
jgi:hypothetical protein